MIPVLGQVAASQAGCTEGPVRWGASGLSVGADTMGGWRWTYLDSMYLVCAGSAAGVLLRRS
jgi:hypothetical protein